MSKLVIFCIFSICIAICLAQDNTDSSKSKLNIYIFSLYFNFLKYSNLKYYNFEILTKFLNKNFFLCN